jgi:hypothetical protein
MPPPAELYPFTIDGGSIEFAESPFPRMMKGTGKVAFLLDDSEPTPAGALSGAKPGWNREFLASHYHDGFWRIVDEEDDREVRARAQNIMKRRDEIARENGQQPIAYRPGMKMPMVRGDSTLLTNPDPGVSVPSNMEKAGEQEFGGTLSVSGGAGSTITEGLQADTVSAAPGNEALQKIILEQGEIIKQLKADAENRKPLSGKRTKRMKTPKGVDGGFEE